MGLADTCFHTTRLQFVDRQWFRKWNATESVKPHLDQRSELYCKLDSSGGLRIDVFFQEQIFACFTSGICGIGRYVWEIHGVDMVRMGETYLKIRTSTWAQRRLGI
jgi:hypothetical protein